MFPFFYKKDQQITIFYQNRDQELVQREYYFWKEDGPFILVKNRYGKVLSFEKSEKNKVMAGWGLQPDKAKVHFLKFNKKTRSPQELATNNPKVDLKKQTERKKTGQTLSNEKEFEAVKKAGRSPRKPAQVKTKTEELREQQLQEIREQKQGKERFRKIENPSF